MRESRTYGSEGGETGKPVFPTPINLRYKQHYNSARLYTYLR